MGLIRLIFLFALGILVWICGGSARFVTELTYDDLSTVVGPGPTLLVFTVEWCEHCRTLAPELKTIAKAAEAAGDAITVARVDAERESAIVQKFNVGGFPTLLYLPEGFSIKNNDVPMEFEDYNWAEIIAEFVNNQTGSTTLALQPRKAFLNWRKRVPYNRGLSGPQRKVEKPDMARAAREMQERLDAELPAPVKLDDSNFVETVFNDSTMSVLIYFYTKQDPFQIDTLMIWRSLSTAFTPEQDNIKVTMMDIGEAQESNAALAKKYANVSDTPSTVMFAQCPPEDIEKEGNENCKRPQSCDDTDIDCGTLSGVFKFVQSSIAERLDIDLSAIDSSADGHDERIQSTEQQPSNIEGEESGGTHDQTVASPSIDQEKDEL